MNHVGAYVDQLREHGIDPPRKVVNLVIAEVKKLHDHGAPDEQIAGAIALLAERGISPSHLPFLLVEAARAPAMNERRERRARLTEFRDAYGWPTGCRLSRGSHGVQEVYDPLGTEPLPSGWTHERPSREAIEQALDALEAIGEFFRFSVLK